MGTSESKPEFTKDDDIVLNNIKERHNQGIVFDQKYKDVLNKLIQDQSKTNNLKSENTKNIKNNINEIMKKIYLIYIIFSIMTFSRDNKIMDKQPKDKKKKFLENLSKLMGVNKHIFPQIIKYIIGNEIEKHLDLEKSFPKEIAMYLSGKLIIQLYNKTFNLISERLNYNGCYQNLDSLLVLPLLKKVNLFDTLPSSTKNMINDDCQNFLKSYLDVDYILLTMEEIRKKELNSKENDTSNKESNCEPCDGSDGCGQYKSKQKCVQEKCQWLGNKGSGCTENNKFEEFTDNYNNNDLYEQFINSPEWEQNLMACSNNDNISNILTDVIDFLEKLNLNIKKESTVKDLDTILSNSTFLTEYSKNISNVLIDKIDGCINKAEYFTNPLQVNANFWIKGLVFGLIFYLLQTDNINKLLSCSLNEIINKNNVIFVKLTIFFILYYIINLF